MHFQSGVSGWHDALRAMPDGAFIKSVNNPGLLREARQVWTAAGRNPAKLHTDYRHHDFRYPFDRPYSWEELKAIWRANYRRFIDRTYLEQYVAYVDMVEELNEYYDTRMAHDPAILAPYLASARAAVAIWNDEYRGKTVTSADGGRGDIPASCKLVIGNSPVGNDIAREFFQLAVSSDNILGTHPYSRWQGQTRDSQDFRYHSGRWSFEEAAYGIKPVYAFTECGPYLGAAEGWRWHDCMAGRVDLLVSGMRAWVRDLQTTAAYREGRILGPGAWFTSGGGSQWQHYELETPQLLALAGVMRDEWHPSTGNGDDMPPLDDATKAQIRIHAEAIIELLDGHVWAVGDVAVARALPLTTYRAPGGPVHDVRPGATYDLHVRAVSADQLWLEVAAGLWVRAADVQPKPPVG